MFRLIMRLFSRGPKLSTKEPLTRAVHRASDDYRELANALDHGDEDRAQGFLRRLDEDRERIRKLSE